MMHQRDEHKNLTREGEHWITRDASGSRVRRRERVLHKAQSAPTTHPRKSTQCLGRIILLVLLGCVVGILQVRVLLEPERSTPRPIQSLN